MPRKTVVTNTESDFIPKMPAKSSDEMEEPSLRFAASRLRRRKKTT
ncbi:UNVERIFIED_CONTAM: hypothetical protein GTU68_004621 [Idotea baltica]|nr:hypothetical protein [Idotea baltica]